MTQGLFDAQSTLITAGAAFFSGEQTRLSSEAATLASLCEASAGVCDELLLLTTADDATFDRREGTFKTLLQQYEAFSAKLMQTRIEALQYNGIAIDLELVRFYLFGREVVVASKL